MLLYAGNACHIVLILLHYPIHYTGYLVYDNLRRHAKGYTANIPLLTEEI
jgi:hypothetical protein